MPFHYLLSVFIICVRFFTGNGYRLPPPPTLILRISYLPRKIQNTQ